MKRTDTERLDWLERTLDGIHVESGIAGTINAIVRRATVYTFRDEYRACSVRDALDMAMNAEPKA